uniref:Uncharacterized protein n=1 Tax=Arundo donax TaxID=35708 RepID=A0A0A8ZM91_ARUDO
MTIYLVLQTKLT